MKFTVDQLFHDVQLSGVFPDSKTFADATPRKDRNEILEAYLIAKGQAGFELSEFVHRHFAIPGELDSMQVEKADGAKEHIENLWPMLERDAQSGKSSDSLIPLPYPYIVPGGRFREIYYWDSYFTMLGLAASGKTELIGSMLKNFAHMIDRFGFIPNGNRTYFLSRSQPPFFSLMVELYSKYAGADVLTTFKDQMLKEYQFWMKGKERLKFPGNPAWNHVIVTNEGWYLNRFWDDLAEARPESYKEDVELADESMRSRSELYRDLRAACESGWDFSSRWLTDPTDLSTIRTTSLLAVDLNCLLYHLESMIEKALEHEGSFDEAEVFHKRKEERAEAINTYFWDLKEEMYSDYDIYSEQCTGIPTLAMAFPLFFGIATQYAADKTAARLEVDFLAEGGLLTSLNHSGQQWDAPNGWAPLQWMTIVGLKRYGHAELAERCSVRWLELNEKVFQESGKMMEKYNVENLGLIGGGGEYPNQDGFGWTNGVFMALSQLF